MKKIITLMAVFCFLSVYGCKKINDSANKQVKETVTCDTEVNNCSITCEGEWCLAIYWPDTGDCTAVCDSNKLKQMKIKTSITLKKTTKIYIAAKNVKLSQIALALDNIKGSKIFIPADKADTPISIAIKNVPLQKAFNSLGLKILKNSK